MKIADAPFDDRKRLLLQLVASGITLSEAARTVGVGRPTAQGWAENPDRPTGHWRSQKTHCKHGHEFTEENTKLTINARGRQQRSCKACEKLRAATPSYRARQQAGHYRRLYGVTVAQRDAMFEAQGRRCACCGTDAPGNKLGWQLDHDHATGAVRGVVCWSCNRLLGFLGDNAIAVAEACARCLRYLNRGNK